MPADIKSARFALRSASLGAINELCLFLADLKTQGKIGGWQFMRHTDLARASIQIDFVDLPDARRAADAWDKRDEDME